jgi:hypothetical protein
VPSNLANLAGEGAHCVGFGGVVSGVEDGWRRRRHDDEAAPAIPTYASAGSGERPLSSRSLPWRSPWRFAAAALCLTAAIARVPVTEDDPGPKDGADWSLAE